MEHDANQTLTRRTFLKQVTLTSAGLCLAAAGGQPAVAEIAPHWKDQIGLELYTVRDLLRKEYEGTIAKLAAIGYKEVEPADPYNNLDPKAYKSLLDKYGLKMLSTHAGATEGPELEKQLEGFQQMGIRYTEIRAARAPRTPRPPGAPGQPPAPGNPPGPAAAATPEAPKRPDEPKASPGPGTVPPGGPRPGPNGGPFPPRPPQTVESVKANCARLNKHGELVKKFGMKILVHNHAGEFDLLDDGKTTQYDLLLTETDPALVTMQLDIGWAYIAGQDALAMFRKNPGRYELWHVKDVKYKEIDPKLTPGQRGRVGKIVTMGEGDIDYKTIFENAALAGLKNFVIEQDTAGQDGRDAIEDCRIAYQTLRRILS